MAGSGLTSDAVPCGRSGGRGSKTGTEEHRPAWSVLTRAIYLELFSRDFWETNCVLF